MSPFFWPEGFVPFEPDPQPSGKGIPCPIWVPDVKDEARCAYCEDDYDSHTKVAQRRGQPA